MTETEYILVSNLQRLNCAVDALSHVTFTDDRQKEVHSAVKKLRQLVDGIYGELDGKIEIDGPCQEPPH